jgi:hypothetical protein
MEVLTKRAAATALYLGIAGSAASATAALDVSYEVIAVSGFGAPGGGSYQSFDDPRVDALGRVLFQASVQDGAPGLESVYLWSGSGEPSLLARRDDPAPGIPGARFLRVADEEVLQLSERGVGVGGRLIIEGNVTSSDDEVLWSETDQGGLAVVAREGDPAPGVPGAGVRDFLFLGPSFGGLGWAFENQTTGVVSYALFRETVPLGIELLALQGDPALGADPDTFAAFDVLASNDAGDVLFRATTSPSNAEGIWIDRATGAREFVVRAGDAVPDVADAAFATFTSSGFNDARDVALVASIAGAGVSSANDTGVWGPDGTGGLRLLAREGSAVPAPAVGTFGQIWLATVDASGGVVIEPIDTTPNGIWYAPLGGGLELVAVVGAPVPGFPAATFASLAEWEVNALGQLVFEAGFTDVGQFNEAVWLWESGLGEPELVARRGDVVTVAPGDVRAIEGIELAEHGSGGQDGRPSGWNDAGQLGVVLRFAGGGEAVARIQVPESVGPAGGVITALALYALRRNRR